MKCADCLYYKASTSDLESNDICLNPKAEYSIGGIRTDRMTVNHSCFAMLSGFCENNKLFVPKLAVA